MRNFHLLMCSLAVYDLLHLVLDVVCFALPEFSRDYRDRVLLHGIPYLIPITQVGEKYFKRNSKRYCIFFKTMWEFIVDWHFPIR